MDKSKLLDPNLMPSHIGIIMDGNGRWAKKRGLARSFGHKEGMKRVIETVETSVELGLESITLFAFSTENWKRPEEEVGAIMNLLVVFINNELNRLVDNNVVLNILGEIDRFPDLSKRAIEKALDRTKDNTGLILNIALNYGGQTEILRGAKLLAQDYKQGLVELDSLDEAGFANYLYTRGQAMPDLIIRPSGEFRVSNFMLYQMAYSELYFSDILWPDFSREAYLEALLDYQKRDRRYGGV